MTNKNKTENWEDIFWKLPRKGTTIEVGNREMLLIIGMAQKEARREAVEGVLEENKYKISANIVRKLENSPIQLRIKDFSRQEYLSLRSDEIRDLINQVLSQLAEEIKKME
jgi:hypothetical protein